MIEKSYAELTIKIWGGFALFKGEFRPVAFFEKPFGRLVVLVRDCRYDEISEIAVNPYFSILEESSSKGSTPQCVGFMIEDACSHCSRLAMILGGPTSIREMINSIAELFPADSADMNRTADRILPLVEAYRLAGFPQ